MKNTKKLLAVVIARGGSKGIPKKNLSIINGLPLIYWTIDAARKSKYIDKIVLSSDDQEIISVALNFGLIEIIRRADELSGDDTPSVDVVIDAIRYFSEFDYVVLLQPTSPLRTSDDIDNAYSSILKSGANSIVSVCKSQETPYWTFGLDGLGRLVKLLDLPNNGHRRQNLPATYYLNGAIYIAKTEYLVREKTFLGGDTLAYVMPENKSLDIDTIEDLEYFKNSLKSKDFD